MDYITTITVDNIEYKFLLQKEVEGIISDPTSLTAE